MKVIEKTPLKNCYWFAGVFEDMPRDEIIGLCCNDSGRKICSAYPRKALILDWGRADLTTAEMLQIAATSPVKDVRIQWK